MNLSTDLVNAIFKYLRLRPWAEVAEIMELLAQAARDSEAEQARLAAVKPKRKRKATDG